jgi:hypothetical protein
MSIEDVRNIFDAASHVCLSVVVFATIVVRLTPTKSDDKKLQKILKDVHKYMAFFPTLGVNPKTKELEEMASKNELQPQ